MYRYNCKLSASLFLLALVAILFSAGSTWAQNTSLTYQGRLTDGVDLEMV